MITKLLINQQLYKLDRPSGSFYNEAFVNDQIVIFPHFFHDDAFELLVNEVKRLEHHKVRRDLTMPGSENTQRKMSTIGGQEVAKMSSLIPMIYQDAELLSFLSGVAGEDVLIVKDLIENHVCNFLHEPHDIHGGHVDTYAFAFNLMIEAPAKGNGGVLEMVPNCLSAQALNNEDQVQHYYIPPNSCYFLRTDQAVHRVSSLKQADKRTIINLAYANNETVNLNSYSTSVLYG